MKIARSIPLAGALLLAGCQTTGAPVETSPAAAVEKPAPVATAAAPAVAAPVSTARGEAVFTDRCKDCHEPAAGDAPERADMAKMAPDKLREILKTGAMQPMAEGLSDADIGELINYLIKPA